MAKDVTFNPLAELKEGVDIIANAVKSTLGPRGRNVILQTNYKTPHVTKDGVTVAKEISLKDPVKNIAVQLVKQAADKTGQLAGDGTTTSTVLTQALFNEGYKYLQAGISPVSLRKGIEACADFTESFIREKAEKIDLDNEDDRKKVFNIATLSANNDPEIGDLVAKATLAASLDGIVAVEESKTAESYVDYTDGYSYDRGYLSEHFITDDVKREVVYENPYILIFNGKIRDINEMAAVAEEVAIRGDKRPLLVIADEIEGQALQFLIVNKVRAGIPLVAVKAPSFGDRRKKMMEDLAIATNGVSISEELGVHIKEVTIDYLGTADKIIVTKDSTTIINGHGDTEEIKNRIEQIKAEREDAQYDWEAQQLQERLSKLIGGVAVIKVGAATEAELKEKKDRIDDSLNATRAAIKEGVVPGGGTIFLRARDELITSNFKSKLPDEQGFGVDCFLAAMKAPFYSICENAGYSGDMFVGQMDLEKGEVFNAGVDTIENAYVSGIIDPAYVCNIAVKNAVSIANLLMSTSVTITNDEDEIDQSQPIGMPI